MQIEKLDCLQNLNSMFQEAICDLLDEGGKENLMLAVCRDASEKSARAFWAFRRLGYLQVLHSYFVGFL